MPANRCPTCCVSPSAPMPAYEMTTLHDIDSCPAAAPPVESRALLSGKTPARLPSVLAVLGNAFCRSEPCSRAVVQTVTTRSKNNPGGECSQRIGIVVSPMRASPT